MGDGEYRGSASGEQPALRRTLLPAVFAGPDEAPSGFFGQAPEAAPHFGPVWRLCYQPPVPDFTEEDETHSPVRPFDGVPQPIVELCQSLTDFVERAIGLRPDFTPDTLPLVDHYLLSAREATAGRPEVLDLTAQALGAYFGEVVRRRLLGFWRVPSPNFHDWQLCGVASFVAFNPIGIGYEVLTLGTDHAGPSSSVRLAQDDARGVADRLALLPEVSEEEYFSLSARYDMLEIVFDAVRAFAESRGYGETHYGPEDYGGDLAHLN